MHFGISGHSIDVIYKIKIVATRKCHRSVKMHNICCMTSLNRTNTYNIRNIHAELHIFWLELDFVHRKSSHCDLFSVTTETLDSAEVVDISNIFVLCVSTASSHIFLNGIFSPNIQTKDIFSIRMDSNVWITLIGDFRSIPFEYHKLYSSDFLLIGASLNRMGLAFSTKNDEKDMSKWAMMMTMISVLLYWFHKVFAHIGKHYETVTVEHSQCALFLSSFFILFWIFVLFAHSGWIWKRVFSIIKSVQFAYSFFMG